MLGGFYLSSPAVLLLLLLLFSLLLVLILLYLLLYLLYLLVFSVFSFFMFVSFYHWFSLLFLFTFFHVFCFVSLSLFPPLVSLSLPPSTVSLSSFLTFLPLPGYLFIFGFLFLPPSPLPSFPYLSSCFSFPVVGYSSFLL